MFENRDILAINHYNLQIWEMFRLKILILEICIWLILLHKEIYYTLHSVILCSLKLKLKFQ